MGVQTTRSVAVHMPGTRATWSVPAIPAERRAADRLIQLGAFGRPGRHLAAAVIEPSAPMASHVGIARVIGLGQQRLPAMSVRRKERCLKRATAASPPPLVCCLFPCGRRRRAAPRRPSQPRLRRIEHVRGPGNGGRDLRSAARHAVIGFHSAIGITMRRQGGVELRGVMVGSRVIRISSCPVLASRLVRALGRSLRRFGFGSR